MAVRRATSIKPLTAKEQAAWRGFVRVLFRAPRLIEADLLATSGLNMAEHHILVLLSEAPDRALRMNKLAEEATLTASGITRAVERLSRRGLVERTRAEFDRRGQIAHLTEDGWQTMLDIYPPHLRTVRTRIMRHLRDLDLTAFTKAMERIAEEEV
jgi:DNA-binding MarR family transcriptional regulator